jgi:hypothetical protein
MVTLGSGVRPHQLARYSHYSLIVLHRPKTYRITVIEHRMTSSSGSSRSRSRESCNVECRGDRAASCLRHWDILSTSRAHCLNSACFGYGLQAQCDWRLGMMVMRSVQLNTCNPAHFSTTVTFEYLGTSQFFDIYPQHPHRPQHR